MKPEPVIEFYKLPHGRWVVTVVMGEQEWHYKAGFDPLRQKEGSFPLVPIPKANAQSN